LKKINVKVDLNEDNNLRHIHRTWWTPSQKQCEIWVSSALAFNTLQTCEKDSAFIAIRLSDIDESAKLNAKYRNKSNPTNVLAFPFLTQDWPEEGSGAPLGDLALCPEIIKNEALIQNKTEENHWAHLIIHGTLHLCGYDHDHSKNRKIMEEIETDALKSLGIANPYLLV
jgi:probable rRNA maturation factor